MDMVRDFERLGDHFENIIELGEYQVNNKVKLSEDAKENINEMFTLVISTLLKRLKPLTKMTIS